ncbi:MAG TPA: DUF308 domain-containing protein [Methanomicrobiales archaeon]|jgi:uncharacterized membrane protein HdeD (DUF308 family)|nr:DUF308 domain-containing protein [Methanomicrobiales archaeon]
MVEAAVVIETTPVKWSSFVIVGILALIIGFLVLLWPNIAVEVGVILFGIVVLIASILTLYVSSKVPKGLPQPVIPIVTAVIGLILGVVVLYYRTAAAVALTWLIAISMIWIGLMEIAMAIFHPEFTEHQWLLGLTGALSVILGGIFIFYPVMGAQVIVMVYVGFFSIFYGALSIATGLEIRSDEKAIEKKLKA